MAEHMRVSLIDPKWKEQRDAMLAKIRETTKASDDEISRNLMGLAAARPDVFGTLHLTTPVACLLYMQDSAATLTLGTHKELHLTLASKLFFHKLTGTIQAIVAF